MRRIISRLGVVIIAAALGGFALYALWPTDSGRRTPVTADRTATTESSAVSTGKFARPATTPVSPTAQNPSAGMASSQPAKTGGAAAAVVSRRPLTADDFKQLTTAPKRAAPRGIAANAEPLGSEPFQDLGRPDTFVSGEERTADDGTLTRVWITRRQGLTYPLVRIEETYAADGRQLLSRREMTADHLVVSLRPGLTEQTIAGVVAQNGGSIREVKQLSKLVLVAFDGTRPANMDAMREALAAESNVRQVSADMIMRLNLTPNDPRYLADELYGMNIISAPAAWDYCTGSTDIVVAVVDTGVSYTHEDLAANLWINPGESGLDALGHDKATNGRDDDGNGFVDDVHGWDFAGKDNDSAGGHWHGTHCAGSIGAVGNNALGVVGVNWAVSIMSLKVFGDGSGSAAMSVILEAWYYAAMMKGGHGINLRATSNSYGGQGATNDPDYLITRDAAQVLKTNQIMVVCAAGNNTDNNDLHYYYPVNLSTEFDNFIGVAASDNRDHLAYFSNYGLTTVHLAAPGLGILSTVPGSGYASASGTSMACPHVAGAVAFAFAISPGSTYAMVKQALLDSVDPLPALAGKCITGGRLNLQNLYVKVGLNVVGSEPAAESAVPVPPVDFVVTFSDPYATNSVAASDLTVNGIPADTFELTGTNRVVSFHFNTSPVTNEGPQTMAIAQNAIRRARDDAGNFPWAATFYHDLAPLTVTATEPADGSTVTLPLSTIVLHFSETVDAASISTNDLVLSQGAVTGVTVVDTQTLSFAISDLPPAEGPLYLSAQKGAFVDVHGSPNVAYAGTIDLDLGTVAFPSALAPREPHGSLIYTAEQPGEISTGGDTDGFTLFVAATQTLTVAVTPVDDGLRPSVALLDPAGAEIVTATAATAGQRAVIQTWLIATTGVYTMVVGSDAGSIGRYILRPILNAAAESDLHNTLATAQDLAASVIALPGDAGRGTVFANAAGADSNDWYRLATAAGDHVTVCAKGATRLELRDSAGTLVAVGAPHRNAGLAVEEYRSTGGPVYAVVTTSAGDYVLVAMRNAVFDLEKNDSVATAQLLGDRSLALGGAKPAILWGNRCYTNETRAQFVTLDPRTGAILSSFYGPDAGYRVYQTGLAYDGDFLYYTTTRVQPQPNSYTLYKIDATNGQVRQQCLLGGYPTALARLSQLAVSFVYFQAPVREKANDVRVRGPKSACGEDLPPCGLRG